MIFIGDLNTIIAERFFLLLQKDRMSLCTMKRIFMNSQRGFAKVPSKKMGMCPRHYSGELKKVWM